MNFLNLWYIRGSPARDFGMWSDVVLKQSDQEFWVKTLFYMYCTSFACAISLCLFLCAILEYMYIHTYSQTCLVCTGSSTN